MYNANDVGLNVQINNNAIINKQAKSKIII